eukprot:Pgem_evm2s12412
MIDIRRILFEHPKVSDFRAGNYSCMIGLAEGIRNLLIGVGERKEIYWGKE